MRDPIKRRESKRAWRLANREKVLAQKQRYRERHPERVKVASKKHYENNKPARLATVRAWALRNPEKVREAGRKCSQKQYAEDPEKLIAAVVASRKKRLENESSEQRSIRMQREYRAQRKWAKNNPERVCVSRRKSKIKNAEKIKIASKIYEQKNKVKRALQLIAWRKANPEKVFAQRSRRKKDLVKHLDYENKRRARKLATTSENCSAKILLLKCEKFCRWCCAKLTETNFTIDHIIALSRGGEHKPDNLAACCAKCNRSKNNKPLSEWLPTVEMA